MKHFVAGLVWAAVLAGCGGDARSGAAADAPSRAVAMQAAPAGDGAAVGADADPGFERANRLLDFGEANFRDWFPAPAVSLWVPPFLVRYYPQTGAYLAVSLDGGAGFMLDGVYVVSGPFGPLPRYVGTISDYVGVAPNYSVTFATDALAVDGYVGEVPPVTLRAQVIAASGTQAVYPRVVDPGGLFAPKPPTDYVGMQLTATLYIGAQAAGEYRGEIQVRLCRDPPCTGEYEGSQARLPHVATLRAAKNLTPLAALAGASAHRSFRCDFLVPCKEVQCMTPV